LKRTSELLEARKKLLLFSLTDSVRINRVSELIEEIQYTISQEDGIWDKK